MSEYIQEKIEIFYQFKFNKMLPSLPTPGTQVFILLCNELQPYGITPAGISLEAPSSKLSDVSLIISLLDDHVTVRILYSSIELYIATAQELDVSKLDKILNIVHASLKMLDAQANNGQIKIRSAFHLTQLKQPVDDFLKVHLSGGSMVNLIPDAFAYKINDNPETIIKDARIVIARSLSFQNALFIDFIGEYSSLEITKDAFKFLEQSIQSTIQMIGL